ncbi:uncharacterized protein LOC110973956 [Acanthaster planci]|uniref:Uncharacterized protein LOC110973956 n=1 Tax=Acanthaster planci TaxID=133434 RepID=A0A8B7XJE0_ACAPL|nr:uncharacterized protein LOC110973956 [Acanthaster planci]XP_022080914.1 uncharacterized protein LOC110973956 [Acanthaster planci]XP_022080915.1 uncharacterized protein LOC110973956 [Acanthaster planci]
MDHQSVRLTSTWNVQGPYDINSILQIQQEDESPHLPRVSTHSIKLVPPSSTNDSNEGDTPSCQLVFSCQPRIAVRSVEIISNARHVELYDNQDSYCYTVRGERLAERGGDQQTNMIAYSASLSIDNPMPRCRLKLVSLTDKCQLMLSQLQITTTRIEEGSYSMTGGRSIDMAKVRDIMSTLQQPISANVQSLMQTIEQYQKNQASVLDDFQQTARAQLSSSGDPKASLASNMAGLLSAFSKASSLQQQAAKTPAATSGGDVALTESSNLPRFETQPRDGSPATAQPPNTDTLAKLMASFGMGRAPDRAEHTEGNASAESLGMLSALRAVCRDVSLMRAADRQAAERAYGPERRDDQGEGSTSENTRQADKMPLRSGMAELEQRLMGYIAAAEKRILGRLDQQMELLQDHIDSRFNTLEALLEGRAGSSSVSRESELVSEEPD